MGANFIITTKHCEERADERRQLNKKGINRQIQLAYERGKRLEDFHTSAEREYLMRKESNSVKAIVYNGFCYILGEDDVFVTMFLLPEWFGKKHFYQGKEKVRNARKYFRLNSCY